MATANGVVLCPPFGPDLSSTYRFHKKLAERLAARGIAVLRIDYHGTGDSPGEGGYGAEPDEVPRWIASIRAAIEHLRASSGVSHVGLFGMRLGAALAVAAAEEGGVDELALLAPVSGRAWLRELTVMAQLHATAPRAFTGQREGDQEVVGFVIRKETGARIRELDPAKTKSLSARRVLVVPRDDLPGAEAKIAEALRARGADVELREIPGYAVTCTDDPYGATAPEHLVEAFAGWFSAGGRPGPAARPVGSDRTDLDADGTRELAIEIGGSRSLFGLLTEPARPGAVAAIIANTGANPRFGTHRLGVALARRFAGAGVSALRLDVSGIGESAPRPGRRENELYRREAFADIGDAIEALARRGYSQFVLAGLCSGAYASFHAARKDARVRGLVLLNPLTFVWRDGWVVKLPHEWKAEMESKPSYKKAVFQLRTWQRLARGEINVAAALANALPPGVFGAVKRVRAGASRAGLEVLALTPLARKFRTLARRGTKVLLVFNDGEPMIKVVDNDLAGLTRYFDRGTLAQVLLEGTDHTFVPVWSQQRVLDVVTDFVAAVGRGSRSP